MSYKDRRASFDKAIINLESAINKRKDADARDLAIKRFELCFELCWKSAQDYLKQKGFICRSAKDAFEQSFKYGLIKNDILWLDMIEDRNLSVHTYEDELAEKIYSKLKVYPGLFKDMSKGLKK